MISYSKNREKFTVLNSTVMLINYNELSLVELVIIRNEFAIIEKYSTTINIVS